MAYTQANVNERVRALVNDTAASVYTNAIILPYLNTALDMLLADMRAHGAYYAKVRGAALDVPASAVPIALTTTSTPALPAGLVGPLTIWERQDGGAEQDYVQMVGPMTLPNFSPTTTLRFWDLAGNLTTGWEIQMLGATAIREIRIDGLYDVTQFTSTQTEAVLIPGSTNAMAYRTAALIVAARGDDAGAIGYNRVADAETIKLIKAETNVQQAHPVRRLPYNGRGRYLTF